MSPSIKFFTSTTIAPEVNQSEKTKLSFSFLIFSSRLRQFLRSTVYENHGCYTERPRRTQSAQCFFVFLPNSLHRQYRQTGIRKDLRSRFLLLITESYRVKEATIANLSLIPRRTRRVHYTTTEYSLWAELTSLKHQALITSKKAATEVNDYY